MERICIFWWIDGPQYWQKKWDFERQSQHLLRSKWIIFHHLMLSILAKCILWFLVFVPENLTKRIEVFSEATAVQDRILLPFNLFQFQHENQSQCLHSHGLLSLEILLNLSFFFFETLSEVTNFCKDWLKVPVLTKLAWPFNFTEWRPVDYLCLEGFAKSFCPTLNKLLT